MADAYCKSCGHVFHNGDVLVVALESKNCYHHKAGGIEGMEVERMGNSGCSFNPDKANNGEESRIGFYFNGIVYPICSNIIKRIEKVERAGFVVVDVKDRKANIVGSKLIGSLELMAKDNEAILVF